jgi:hypothetical protein
MMRSELPQPTHRKWTARYKYWTVLALSKDSDPVHVSLIGNRVRERVPMALSGHKTRAVFERYNITSEEDLAAAAERIDQYVGERRKEPSKIAALAPKRA